MSMLPDAAQPEVVQSDAVQSGRLGRRPEIAAFLDALAPCLEQSTRHSPADHAFAAGIVRLLANPGASSVHQAGARPEVLRHLDAALAGLEDASPELRRLGAAFAAISSVVPWSKRQHAGPDADRFAEGHGNAIIVGPGGAEERDDVVLGVSLMAPHIRYPDHSHPPDELYLVLSEGEWRQGGSENENGWVRPGLGGTVRNSPNVVHAMRAGARPLLAVWALRPASAG